MNYIWSKKSLLQFIESSINKVVKEKNYSFSDLFAWTWIIWKHFKEKGHKVISNDLQYYSFVLNKNYIENHKELEFKWLFKTIDNLESIELSKRKEEVLKYLDWLKEKKGFIYKNYSLWWTKEQRYQRLYFSDENSIKCDTIRIKIEKWNKEKSINKKEYYFLIASLLESIDKVANTASIYGSFLKELKRSARKKMSLESAEFFLNDNEHKVYNCDTNELVKRTSHDVVYLDPPYNERQYSANYHLLETISRYDNPKIRWKTWLRDYSKQRSLYCKKSKVKKSFKELISNIDAKYIFLSYNNEGLMSFEDIKEIMSKRWEYWVFKKRYKRFKSSKASKSSIVTEYLHYVVVE